MLKLVFKSYLSGNKIARSYLFVFCLMSTVFSNNNPKTYFNLFRPTESAPVLTKWNVGYSDTLGFYIIEKTDTNNRVTSIVFMHKKQVCSFSAFEPSIINYKYNKNEIIETRMYANGSFMSFVDVGIPYQFIYSLSDSGFINNVQTNYYLDTLKADKKDNRRILKDVEFAKSNYIQPKNISSYYYSYAKMNGKNPVCRDFKKDSSAIPYDLIFNYYPLIEKTVGFNDAVKGFSILNESSPVFQILKVKYLPKNKPTVVSVKWVDTDFANDIVMEDTISVSDKIEFDIRKNINMYCCINKIFICNGYLKSEKDWLWHSRLKKIKMSIKDGPCFYLNLNDTFNRQTFNMSRGIIVKDSVSIILEVLDIYKGSKYQNAIIGKIKFAYM
jgi:hypothetical protein